jgi:hypothetical protein
MRWAIWRRERSSESDLVENARLTRRQAEILDQDARRAGRSDESELVCDGGHAVWLGLDRVSKATLFALLRLCAISGDGLAASLDIERYHINGTGRAILARHEERGARCPVN